MSQTTPNLNKADVMKQLHDKGVTDFDGVVEKIVASAPKNPGGAAPEFWFCHIDHYCIYVSKK